MNLTARWIFNLLTTVIFMFKLFASVQSVIESEEDKVVSYKGYSVIRVVPRTKDSFSYLTNLTYSKDVSYWLEPSSIARPVDIMISPKKKASVMKGLFHYGMHPKVQIEDLERLISRSKNDSDEISARVATSEEYFFSSYRRLDEIYNYLEGLQSRNKDTIKIENFGKSWEGRDLKVVKIGANVNSSPPNNSKPIIYIQGGIHAREWIAPATVVYIATTLANEALDETDKRLIESFEWWLVPSANPDGYEYSHTHNRNWRKTRSKQVGICRGVDPNRNFGFYWGGKGTSGDTCSDIFRGSKPFSEPETRAIRDLVLGASPRVLAFLDMHSYSQVWLYPWGYGEQLPDDHQDLHQMAKLATTALAKVHGTRYRVGSTTRLLYAAAGGADDWAKGTANIKYAYTVELRDDGRYGFVLPSRYIIPTGQETWTALKAFADGLKEELDHPKIKSA
ncbi:carboxypeptidase B isoform X2 [Tetranychus urticae]|nr:carboxypeptidase B isoform X2 [Tetranychus urticae]